MKKICLLLFIAICTTFFGCNNTANIEKINGTTEALELPLIDSMQKLEEIESIIISEKYIDYKVGDTTLNGVLFSKNDSLQKPGIIVLGEWWGINDQVKEKALSLAKLGYVTMIPDLYDNSKDKGHPSDTKNMAMELYTNTFVLAERFNVVLDSLKHLTFVDSTKIGVVGYSFGGSIALMMANSGVDLDAVAVFHSGLELPVMPNKFVTPAILICNGENDSLISKKSIRNYRTELNKIHATYKHVIYKEASHGFTNRAADSLAILYDLPISYNKEADEKSWQQLVMFLNNYLNQ